MRSCSSPPVLLTKQRAEALRQTEQQPEPGNGNNHHENDDTTPKPDPIPEPEPEPMPDPPPDPGSGKVRVRLSGSIPAEVWSRFGTKILPKLKAGEDLAINTGQTLPMPPQCAVSLDPTRIPHP